MNPGIDPGDSSLPSPRTRWHLARDYHTVELEFTGNRIVFKDWWDPGHDPNRAVATAAEFLAGALHLDIERELGRAVLDEVIATVTRLTSGGPGVAEPPAGPDSSPGPPSVLDPHHHCPPSGGDCPSNR